MCNDGTIPRTSSTSSSNMEASSSSSLKPPGSSSSRRRSPSPAKRAGVQLRLETTAAEAAAATSSSAGNGELPFSPTHLSPTANESSVPASFSLFQALALPTSSPSSIAAPRPSPSPSPSSSSLGVESLNLSDNGSISRRSSPSPRPSLPAIHTSFPRSASNRSLLASGAVVSEERNATSVAATTTATAAAATPISTTPHDSLASASPSRERPSANKQLSAASWLPPHTTGHFGHHASPLSSSASHTTYLSSAISDPHAHSLHNSPRRPIGTPFAERAFAASSLGYETEEESVEGNSAVEKQTEEGWWAKSRRLAQATAGESQDGLDTARLESSFAAQQQQGRNEGRRPRRRRREVELMTPLQLWARLASDEQTDGAAAQASSSSTEARRAERRQRVDEDLPAAGAAHRNGTPPRDQTPPPSSSSTSLDHHPHPLHYPHFNSNHNNDNTARLSSQLLIIDVRAPSLFLASRLRNSINLAPPPPHQSRLPSSSSSSETTLEWLEQSVTTSMSKRRLSQLIDAAATAVVAAPRASALQPHPRTASLPLSHVEAQSNTTAEQRFWEHTDVLVLGADESMPELVGSGSGSSSGSGNESEDGRTGQEAPRTPPQQQEEAHTRYAAKAFVRVLQRIRAPVLADEQDVSSSGGKVYVVQGGFEAVRSAPGSDAWLCSGDDGDLLDVPSAATASEAQRSGYSPIASATRVRSATHSPRSPWSARLNAIRPATGIDVGAANRTERPVQALQGGNDGEDEQMAPPPSSLARFAGAPLATATPSAASGSFATPALAPPPPPKRGTSTGARRPMLARLDTSEQVKTLGVPTGRRLSATSPRLRLQTDVVGGRLTPARSATLDSLSSPLHTTAGRSAVDVEMSISSPMEDRAAIASGASNWPSGSSLSASPKAVGDLDLPPLSALGGNLRTSPFSFTTRPPTLDESTYGGGSSTSPTYSSWARRGSEPPSTGLSPTLGHRASLLPEPQTPTTRSMSVSSAESLSSDFLVSEILPGFLYLGPDICTTREAQHLTQVLGVKRILNCAAEIEEGGGRHLELHRGGNGVEKYRKIPLQDHVEAKGVQKFIEDACGFLDDARLHSTPTYVHCKAGKSRSVLVVMAYLIHHLGWPLQRSYAHVVDRRRAVSPNIGFVAELMRFEERRLGGAGKARGLSGAMDEEMDGEERQDAGSSSSSLARRRERDPHARDSLPPMLHALSSSALPHTSTSPADAGGEEEAQPGTSPNATLETPARSPTSSFAFELEQRGSDGRYRSRRPPADAVLLAPNRRATLAGMGSQHTFRQLMQQQHDAEAEADA